MNACKVILIILLALATLKNFLKVLVTEGNEQLWHAARLVIGKTLWWLLFVCAGITTFN